MLPDSNIDGCKDFTWFDFPNNSYKDGKKVFLLIERGGCSFLKKIDSATKIGATVILISNFKNESSEVSMMQENWDK